jgi:hypothetical protein
LDPLDGLEVRLAATLSKHPAGQGPEISQRVSRSLAIALRIATRSGPVLVQESVRPSLGILPVVHGTGYRRVAALAEDRGARWIWFDGGQSPSASRWRWPAFVEQQRPGHRTMLALSEANRPRLHQRGQPAPERDAGVPMLVAGEK